MLTDAQFERFSTFIYEISGIRFQSNKNYFVASKLQNRCTALNLPNFDAYYDYLQKPSSKLEEYPKLMDEVTINETFFFRNQPQLDAFEQDILKPKLIDMKAKGQNRLRVWSCAASTGDEAYTTALQLISLPEAQGMAIEIVGTDICRKALETARNGVYKPYAVRNIPQDLMQKYFTHDEATNTYQLSDTIKKMVTFQECNLIDENRIKMLGHFDIAFCRNVLIYFDEPSKEKALWNMYHAIKDDGYLIVGHSENIYSQRHIFKQDKDHTAAIAYVKAPPGTPKL